MSTRSILTTNDLIAECLSTIDELISWAAADAQHALENDAPGVAEDDCRRGRDLIKARKLIEGCAR